MSNNGAIKFVIKVLRKNTDETWDIYQQGCDFKFGEFYASVCAQRPREEARFRVYVDGRIVMTFTKWREEPERREATKRDESALAHKRVRRELGPIEKQRLAEAYDKWRAEQPQMVRDGATNLCEVCRNAKRCLIDQKLRSVGVAYCCACYEQHSREMVEYYSK